MIHLGETKEGLKIKISKGPEGYNTHHDNRHFPTRKRAVRHGFREIVRSYFPNVPYDEIDEFLKNDLVDNSQMEVGE